MLFLAISKYKSRNLNKMQTFCIFLNKMSRNMKERIKNATFDLISKYKTSNHKKISYEKRKKLKIIIHFWIFQNVNLDRTKNGTYLLISRKYKILAHF